MTSRGSTIHVPIWVRIPGFIALVLVAVVLGAMLLGTAGTATDGGGGGTDHNQDETGQHAPPGGRGH